MDARAHASALARFLDAYRALADAHVKDFFVEELWTKQVPSSWRAHLDALSVMDMASLLRGEMPASKTGAWPLSLYAFFATCHALRLPNQLAPRGGAAGSGQSSTPRRGQRAGGSIDSRGRCADEQLLSSKILRAAVKPKKMHEIVHAAALIDSVGRAGGCARVVDLGSGLGYLSRCLAFEYAWPVVAVEGEASNVAGASRIDERIERKAREQAQATGTSIGSLRHVAAMLSPSTTPEEFWQIVLGDDADELPAANADAAPGTKANSGSPSVAAEAEGASVLVGLHTCGNLAPTTLRVYHHAGSAVGALVSVGCCYMRLSEAALPSGVQDASAEASAPPHGSAAEEEAVGFPMSEHVLTTRIVAGYHLRELACHSLVAYAERLRAAAAEADGGEATLRHHARRAALELLLRHCGAQQRARGERALAGVSGSKGAAARSFEEYAADCFQRVGLPPIARDEWPALMALVDEPLRYWRRVVVWYILRLMFGPLWEALILLDRLLYLREHGHAAALVPLFDPSLSPRSYALVSVKSTAVDKPTLDDGSVSLQRCWPCVADNAALADRWADVVEVAAVTNGRQPRSAPVTAT